MSLPTSRAIFPTSNRVTVVYCELKERIPFSSGFFTATVAAEMEERGDQTNCRSLRIERSDGLVVGDSIC